MVPRAGLTVGSPPGPAAVLRPTRSPTTGTTLGAAVGTALPGSWSAPAPVIRGAASGSVVRVPLPGIPPSPGLPLWARGKDLPRFPALPTYSEETPRGQMADRPVLHRTYAHRYPQARERLHTALSTGPASTLLGPGGCSSSGLGWSAPVRAPSEQDRPDAIGLDRIRSQENEPRRGDFSGTAGLDGCGSPCWCYVSRETFERCFYTGESAQREVTHQARLRFDPCPQGPR